VAASKSSRGSATAPPETIPTRVIIAGVAVCAEHLPRYRRLHLSRADARVRNLVDRRDSRAWGAQQAGEDTGETNLAR
jgi:hypothetical protein